MKEEKTNLKEWGRLTLSLIRKLQAEEGEAAWRPLRDLAEEEGLNYIDLAWTVDKLIENGTVYEPHFSHFKLVDEDSKP